MDRTFARKVNRVIPIFVCLLLLGCTKPYQQPPKPRSVAGWASAVGKDHFFGELLLYKGQSTDNGSIGVTVVDLIPPDPFAEAHTFNSSPRATFRFYRVSDHSSICDLTVDLVNGYRTCNDASVPPFINVMAINTKDAWVHFSLWDRVLN